MFLHIDCNTFFASCEVATNPALAGKPVVVANENEAGGGVILALTAEAKALGLKRGMPVFKVRRLIEAGGVTLCRADHDKYRRISRQIMEAVVQQAVVLDFVQYSVDEFFGTLPLSDPDQLRHYAAMVKDMITLTTGIPVSCGLGETYTLAKTATHFAKHYPGYHGICVLTPDKCLKALSLIDAADVWGIGRKTLRGLMLEGVTTAADFINLKESRVQQHFGTRVLKTWLELQGIPSIELREHALQQTIMQSHTFGYMLDTLEALEPAVRGFAQRCAATLRRQGGVCGTVTLFLSTNRHRPDLPQYSNSATRRLPSPTADTAQLLKAASALLRTLYRPGYRYKQAGIILGAVEPLEGQQLDIFNAATSERRQHLLEVADSINARFGQGTIGFA